MRDLTPKFLIFLLSSLIIGLGLTYYSLNDGKFIGTYHRNEWTAWPKVGAPNPDPYTRAFVALSNNLQLGRAEGVEFIAQRDDKGDILLRECNYILEGDTPVAALWTLRAVSIKKGLITPKGKKTNLQSRRLVRNNDGTFIIFIGKKLKSKNWLEISGNGPFELVLTFYDAPILAGFGSKIIKMPSIKKMGCE